jgi:hypothetical protein
MTLSPDTHDPKQTNELGGAVPDSLPLLWSRPDQSPTRRERRSENAPIQQEHAFGL